MHWRNVPGITDKKDRKLSYNLKALSNNGPSWRQCVEADHPVRVIPDKKR